MSLSAPAVKRRVDRLRNSGSCRASPPSSTTPRWGTGTEASSSCSSPRHAAGRGGGHAAALPEVVEAWSVTGEADAIARVRAHDNGDFERVIIEMQATGPVERTRSQVVLSRLVGRAPG